MMILNRVNLEVEGLLVKASVSEVSPVWGPAEMKRLSCNGIKKLVQNSGPGTPELTKTSLRWLMGLFGLEAGDVMEVMLVGEKNSVSVQQSMER